MDRSSLNKVETTYDYEKRLAFKAKLASQIDTVESTETLSNDETSFNGVPIGGTLFHPSLGEGILVEVSHKNNEVLVDFGTNGLVGLVLTMAQAFVHAPVKKEAKIVDDAFLGSEIQSR